MFPVPLIRQHGAASTDARAQAVLILDPVLAILRERRNVDFSEYRRGTIERRLANRMIASGVKTSAAYLEHLNASEGELDRLLANLTIKVSRFYRNRSVFDFLRDRALPLLRTSFPGRPLRVWSAGCASGEEPYTIAMLLGRDDSVLATDIDATALDSARAGRYAADAFAEAPPSLVSEFVCPAADGGRLAISDSIRRRVTFARHDLASGDAPAGAPFHLICCRNVLIYFSRALQRRALCLLSDNLVPGGVLCLGEAEWPSETAFEVLDRRNKIFRRPLAQETRQ